MKTITILADFSAYPTGSGPTGRTFRAGEIVHDLTEDDAGLYVAKGLASRETATVSTGTEAPAAQATEPHE